jgi:hypothetical protein
MKPRKDHQIEAATSQTSTWAATSATIATRSHRRCVIGIDVDAPAAACVGSLYAVNCMQEPHYQLVSIIAIW